MSDWDPPSRRRTELSTAVDSSSTDDHVEAVLDAAAGFSRAVSHEAYRLKVRDAAARQRANERAGATERPKFVTLADFLAVQDDETEFRVDQLWPTGGRVVLAAQYKTGKSTLVANVIRSLADGEPLLGEYRAEPATVALIDDELDEKTLRRWLRAHGIVNESAVRLVSLRGKLSTFDILDPETRAEWAKDIAGVDVVILDCLRPALDAIGLSEDKDAGKFLVAFDELLGLADVREAAVVHHMGHTGERSRGDSRILDWPDATWKLVRENTDDPSSARYFSAFGRDVDVPESRLGFDPESRRLHIAGGNRKDAAVDELVEPLLELLRANPDGLSGRGIERILCDDEGHKHAPVRSAVKRASEAGLTIQSEGPKRAILHHANASATSATEVRQRTSGECDSAPLGRTRTHTRSETESSATPSHTLDTLVELPGRCTECAFHVATQGHRDGCSKAVAS